MTSRCSPWPATRRSSARWLAVGVVCAILGCTRTPSAPTPAARGDGLPSAGANRSDAATATTPEREPSVAESLAAERWTLQLRDAIRERVRQLSAREDADSQLAVALLLQLTGTDHAEARDAQRLQALQKASAGGDALASWLLALNCASAGCTAAATARLRELEPDNAAVWLFDLHEANREGDQAEVDRLLSRAAQATHFDEHYGETGARLLLALQDVPLPPSNADLDRTLLGSPLDGASANDLRTFYAAQVDAAVGFIRYASVFSACDPNKAPAARAAPCTAIYSRMSQGRTLVAQTLGLSRLVQSSTGPAQAVWRERLRKVYWLSAADMPQTPDAAYMRALWADGEVATVQHRLDRLGQGEPPLDWLPKNPRARALVLTGRPPPDDGIGRP